jgi:acyl-CoA thioesterase-2
LTDPSDAKTDLATSAPSVAGAVEPLPCALTVRAWWGDELVAESSAAVRVEEADLPPRLFLPIKDVRLEAFRPEDDPSGTSFWKGGGEPWSIGPMEHPRAAARADWHNQDDASRDGRDVLRTFADWPASEWLCGLATFDHRRVVLELVDPVDAGDQRGVTVKRFPTWGDATDLIDILDLRPDGQNRFRSVARASHLRAVVEGSQMLGQAIVAAGRHSPGRRTVSAHMIFMRPADAALPLNFELRALSSGRSFTTLAIEATQSERPCASANLLLDATAADLIRHSVDPPDVPGPYACESYDMSVTGRDVRVVDGAYTDEPSAPVGPPVLDAWVRFRELPDDPYLHAGLLAQFTGHMPIAAALRPHPGVGQRQAHRSLSTAINAIGLSLHADVRADRWMLYHHLSTFAGNGMTRSECRVHDEEGRLLASFTVDAMVRGFEGMTAPSDDRRAL